LDFDANAQSSGKPDGPQIIADRSTSALIIVATESEYAMIEPAIRKLDILPMQVLIEATAAILILEKAAIYPDRGCPWMAHLTRGAKSDISRFNPTAFPPMRIGLCADDLSSKRRSTANCGPAVYRCN
jgi:type II secretory pathway component GspD/PulD (secretin)